MPTLTPYTRPSRVLPAEGSRTARILARVPVPRACLPGPARRAASKADRTVPRGRVVANADMSWLWTFGSVPELPPADVVRISEDIAMMAPEERSVPSAPRIIDVRTETEYEGGHIQGAVNASFLPPWSFEERITPLLKTIQKDTPVLLVCLSAHRSIGALKWMRQQGYTNVQQLAGGMKAWRSAGLPETKASS